MEENTHTGQQTSAPPTNFNKTQRSRSKVSSRSLSPKTSQPTPDSVSREERARGERWLKHRWVTRRSEGHFSNCPIDLQVNGWDGSVIAGASGSPAAAVHLGCCKLWSMRRPCEARRWFQVAVNLPQRANVRLACLSGCVSPQSLLRWINSPEVWISVISAATCWKGRRGRVYWGEIRTYLQINTLGWRFWRFSVVIARVMMKYQTRPVFSRGCVEESVGVLFAVTGSKLLFKTREEDQEEGTDCDL